MGPFEDYLIQKIKERVPAPLVERLSDDWLLKLFRDSATKWEFEDIQEKYEAEIRYKPYTSTFNARRKREVRERDRYTCQVCGKTEEELQVVLSIHHIITGSTL